MSSLKRSAKLPGMAVIPKQKFLYDGEPSVLLRYTERGDDGLRWAHVSPSMQGKVLWKARDLRGADEVEHDGYLVWQRAIASEEAKVTA